MHKPYRILLLISALVTIILFALDGDPYTFTLPSIIGYLVVGLIYISFIFTALACSYFIGSKIWRLVKR